jgi:uncharacterized membrane protein YtjA (UPF0391 family)
MGVPESDEPPAIYDDETKQELFGRGPSRFGLEAYEVIAIIVAIVGAAVGFDQISNGSQWILLGAILVILFGLIIALNPQRRE